MAEELRGPLTDFSINHQMEVVMRGTIIYEGKRRDGKIEWLKKGKYVFRFDVPVKVKSHPDGIHEGKTVSVLAVGVEAGDVVSLLSDRAGSSRRSGRKN